MRARRDRKRSLGQGRVCTWRNRLSPEKTVLRRDFSGRVTRKRNRFAFQNSAFAFLVFLANIDFGGLGFSDSV